MVCVERALGPPIQDPVGVRENAGRCQKMLKTARPAGRHLAAAEALPWRVGARQHDPHLLHARVAIDDDEQLRAIDFIAAGGDCCLGVLDPGSRAVGRIDDQVRDFLAQCLT